MAQLRKFWFVLATSLLLTACSTAADTKGDQSGETIGEVQASADAYLTALAEHVQAVTWPIGYQADPNRLRERTLAPNSVIPDPQPYADMIVALFQQCAWNMTWLDARQAGDDEAENSALDTLLTIVPTLWDDAASQQVSMDLAQSAALDDPTRVQAYVDQNCLPLDWTVN